MDGRRPGHTPFWGNLRIGGDSGVKLSKSSVRQHGQVVAFRYRVRIGEDVLSEDRNPLVFGGGFPLGFGFSTPLFRIFIVHPLHLLRDVRMILCNVLNH